METISLKLKGSARETLAKQKRLYTKETHWNFF